MIYLYTNENGVMFRKADTGNAQILLDLKNESHFGTHTLTLANYTSQVAWLESISHETHCPRNLVLMAALDQTTQYAVDFDFGVLKLFHIDWQSRRAEIGWDVFKDFRQKGYGKKLVKAGVDFAFHMLNLHRLEAQILVTN